MNSVVVASKVRLATLALWLAAGIAPTTWAQAPAAELRAAPGGRSAISSADHRFMVSGMTSAENMVLVRQLADLAGQVEEKTGMPLPLQRDQVLGVMVQSSSAPDAQMLKMQGWDEGRFYQRLVAPSALRLDREDLMEAACWLMLNRYAVEYSPASQRIGMGAAIPDWIAAGLAQNTQAALRARNRDWISRELAENRALPLHQVVKQELLPPGRWREKAYAAAAVEFLFPDGDLNVWAALFKAVGTRQAVDAAWLRKNCPALQNQKPEEAWQNHLQASAKKLSTEAWSDRGLQLEQKLLQTLNFSPRELAAGLPAEVPQELFARDLVDYRNQAWASAVAAALALQVQSLELGAPPALQEVLATYVAFFNQLGTPPPEKRAWWQRSKKDPQKLQPPDDATWHVALNQLWMRAERVHQGFLENNQSRKRYVDSFDGPAPGEFDESAPSASDLPRTRLQKYVDEAEEKVDQPPF
jgi:hypothetical protein